jgi:hypothetical protein
MYTRADLARRIADAANVYKQRSRIMAIVAVAGGLAQLWLHRIVEARYDPATSRSIEIAVFLVYAAVTAGLVVWTNRASVLTPRCQACGALLKDMSGRMAMTTGKCDQCGAQVVE